MLCYEGKLSLYCFAIACSLILSITMISEYLLSSCETRILLFLFGIILINLILYTKFNGFNYQISIRASFLGFIFGISLIIVTFASTKWKPFGLYGIFIAFFHYSEFLGIALSNPKTLSISTFLLYHSTEYVIAAVSSWIEFIIEVLLFPGLKEHYSLWVIGTLLCLLGEILRKLAMLTIGTNFTHVIRISKDESHCLITHGIYGIMRHPSYVGWFWWSIGTQIILANPLCLIIYTTASWKFFKERIYIEEMTLLDFFGKNYYDYQQRVPILLPFINGYQLPKGLVDFLKQN